MAALSAQGKSERSAFGAARLQTGWHVIPGHPTAALTVLITVASSGAGRKSNRSTQAACGGSIPVSTPGSIPVSVKGLFFCPLHANEIPRTDPLVQVDYVRVVDLDIGASKSDSAIRVVTISERAGRTRACDSALV
jgi:hypothetical protein